MKPDWDELGEKYENSKKVLIGDVDCTSDGGKPLCERFGVQGYPTLKVFNPPDTEGEAYEGGRTLKELKKFVKKLGPGCSPATWSKCTQQQKDELKPYLDMPKEELEAALEASKAKVKASQEQHDALMKGLQEQYEASEKANKAVAEAEAPKIKLMKAALVPAPTAELTGAVKDEV